MPKFSQRIIIMAVYLISLYVSQLLGLSYLWIFGWVATCIGGIAIATAYINQKPSWLIAPSLVCGLSFWFLVKWRSELAVEVPETFMLVFVMTLWPTVYIAYLLETDLNRREMRQTCRNAWEEFKQGFSTPRPQPDETESSTPPSNVFELQEGKQPSPSTTVTAFGNTPPEDSETLPERTPRNKRKVLLD